MDVNAGRAARSRTGSGTTIARAEAAKETKTRSCSAIPLLDLFSNLVEIFRIAVWKILC
jgi:hypothetical protein